MADIYTVLRGPKHHFSADDIKRLFALVSRERVETLAAKLEADLRTNLPQMYGRRESLADYRANPYVLLATANLMDLSKPEAFASFLFNSKLAMGLETSFGKIVERAFVGGYPLDCDVKWTDPPEKIAEFAVERNASGRAAKAAIRNNSVWREIDKSVTVGNRRYLTSIKSGPNTINDTQVQGMVDAIVVKHAAWWEQSKTAAPNLEGLDIVVGLTYGTERTTNNKDNQILAKLLDKGFEELDPTNAPGILVDSATKNVRVYRRIGRSFWAWIGNPSDERKHPQIFLEILLATSIALEKILQQGSTIEEGINQRLVALATALLSMQLSKDTLPLWVAEGISEKQLFWFTTALSAFFDEGV